MEASERFDRIDKRFDRIDERFDRWQRLMFSIMASFGVGLLTLLFTHL